MFAVAATPLRIANATVHEKMQNARVRSFHLSLLLACQSFLRAGSTRVDR